MDRLDALKERLKLLPATDPDFQAPMTGETQALYDAVQARWPSSGIAGSRSWTPSTGRRSSRPASSRHSSGRSWTTPSRCWSRTARSRRSRRQSPVLRCGHGPAQPGARVGARLAPGHRRGQGPARGSARNGPETGPAPDSLRGRPGGHRRRSGPGRDAIDGRPDRRRLGTGGPAIPGRGAPRPAGGRCEAVPGRADRPGPRSRASSSRWPITGRRGSNWSRKGGTRIPSSNRGTRFMHSPWLPCRRGIPTRRPRPWTRRGRCSSKPGPSSSRSRRPGRTASGNKRADSGRPSACARRSRRPSRTTRSFSTASRRARGRPWRGTSTRPRALVATFDRLAADAATMASARSQQYLAGAEAARTARPAATDCPAPDVRAGRAVESSVGGAGRMPEAARGAGDRRSSRRGLLPPARPGSSARSPGAAWTPPSAPGTRSWPASGNPAPTGRRWAAPLSQALEELAIAQSQAEADVRSLRSVARRVRPGAPGARPRRADSCPAVGRIGSPPTSGSGPPPRCWTRSGSTCQRRAASGPGCWPRSAMPATTWSRPNASPGRTSGWPARPRPRSPRPPERSSRRKDTSRWVSRVDTSGADAALDRAPATAPRPGVRAGDPVCRRGRPACAAGPSGRGPASLVAGDAGRCRPSTLPSQPRRLAVRLDAQCRGHRRGGRGRRHPRSGRPGGFGSPGPGRAPERPPARIGYRRRHLVERLGTGDLVTERIHLNDEG